MPRAEPGPRHCAVVYFVPLAGNTPRGPGVPRGGVSPVSGGWDRDFCEGTGGWAFALRCFIKIFPKPVVLFFCCRFRIDNTDHIIDVNKGNIAFEYDQVNIICPVYVPGTDEENAEKYIIYNVSIKKLNVMVLLYFFSVFCLSVF